MLRSVQVKIKQGKGWGKGSSFQKGGERIPHNQPPPEDRVEGARQVVGTEGGEIRGKSVLWPS